MISLPLPRDVEDTAIATVSRPSVNRRPTEGGKGLAILRPGVMGLTVRRAPPFAPPRCCHPLATTRRFGRAISALSTDCQEAAMGVRRRPGTASGGPYRSPLPGAPSGDPTPITPSVSYYTESLLSTVANLYLYYMSLL